MVENNMPAVEAENVEMDVSDTLTYELAFHVLPTIAEGEVEGVLASIKDIISKDGGEIFDEETPERFELAYEVEKHMEGKNRKFHSAYFGWVRFKAQPENTVKINAEIEHNKSILRHLLVKLTKVEEENPFRFHDAIRDQKQVTTVGESEIVPDFSTVSGEETELAKENVGEVDQAALDKALEEKEV